MASSKHVVFDIVGTCVSYDAIFDAIDVRLGDKLRAEGVKPSLLGYLWIEVTEREYTYLSMNNNYVPFRDIFTSIFYRMLYMSGIQDPHSFASDDDLQYILKQYMKLEARPGIAECFQILRDNGFTVWALTAGDAERVSGYFTHNNIPMPMENFISCDSFKIGKPDPKVYKMVVDRLGDDEKWFAAAHNWDSLAGKLNGFKAAYCSIWEKIPCSIFGEIDVSEDDFPSMARAIGHIMSTSSKPTSRSPVANPVHSFWTTEPSDLDDHRTTPELPKSCNVLIIGAGLSGVGTAYHLFKDNPNPPSTVILEARKVVSGATGRNGGHVKPDLYFNVDKYIKMFGVDKAAKLVAFEAAHPHAVKKLVESEGIDCDFQLTRAVDVHLDPEHAQQTEAAYRELLKGGMVDLTDVAFIPKKDAERISGVKGAQCCFTYTAAHLFPAKLVRGLLAGLLAKGLNVQANTPVKSIIPSPDAAKGRWIVTTDRGSIIADKVVFATNGYTSAILPEYVDRIVPIRGVCSHIVSPKGKDSPHLVNTYSIRFNSIDNDYLIPRADGSIIVGGARQRFWRQRDLWFDNVRDDELVESAVPYFDGYMQRHFRGWEDSAAKTAQVWTGIMGYSSDFMPHLGNVPGKPGQYIIAGFTGHGMPEILLSSKAVAELIRDGTPIAQSGVPEMFETSEARITATGSPMEEQLSRTLWAEGDVKAKL
ncbi:FAD dependent oxidoreductase-domain-containing protein [Plectosphaerella plurivora]|uniref:FAD dependent oxidoreductase-domain-containing protein n=1 Tax=Plectosphaerella plurivora TaxID=936078 RepID=A0A9P9A6R0_9PEZI|nr:FAD dependent oxidoreductase-domain-containing protein [Plectosphaerella plurivora]